MTNFSSKEIKEVFVKNIFSRISGYYDFMNDFLTFGVHRIWKKQACENLNILNKKNKNFCRILDLACGSGDLAFKFEKLYRKKLNNLGISLEITGVDFCQEMLEQAKLKAKKLNSSVIFQQADALNLLFENNYFDGILIGYGLRNTGDFKLCLEECLRVCAENGKISILDLSHPCEFVDKISSFYRVNIIPFIAKVFFKNSEAYEYLINSAKAFLTQKELVSLLELTGWKNIKYKNLLWGISALHWAEK